MTFWGITKSTLVKCFSFIQNEKVNIAPQNSNDIWPSREVLSQELASVNNFLAFFNRWSMVKIRELEAKTYLFIQSRPAYSATLPGKERLLILLFWLCSTHWKNSKNYYFWCVLWRREQDKLMYINFYLAKKMHWLWQR